MDTPQPPVDHAWVHEHLAAYVADGLDPAERQRFDDHINHCPACFDAFAEARDADRLLQRTLGSLAPAADFENRLTTHLREKIMHPVHRQYFLRRAAYGTAAAVALAATGVFANYAIHQNGRFNNPLSMRLVGQADLIAPALGQPLERFRSAVVAENVRGIAQSNAQYGSSDVNVKDLKGTDGTARSASLREAKTRVVGNLVADAGRLIEVSQFKEAASLLSQATVIDPQSSEAKLMLRLVENKLYAKDYDELVKRRGLETMRQTNDSAEHLTPYADLMIYPENWADITKKKLDDKATRPSDGPADLGKSSPDKPSFITSFNQTAATGGTNSPRTSGATGSGNKDKVDMPLPTVPGLNAASSTLSKGIVKNGGGYLAADGLISPSSSAVRGENTSGPLFGIAAPTDIKSVSNGRPASQIDQIDGRFEALKEIPANQPDLTSSRLVVGAGVSTNSGVVGQTTLSSAGQQSGRGTQPVGGIFGADTGASNDNLKVFNHEVPKSYVNQPGSFDVITHEKESDDLRASKLSLQQSKDSFGITRVEVDALNKKPLAGWTEFSDLQMAAAGDPAASRTPLPGIVATTAPAASAPPAAPAADIAVRKIIRNGTVEFEVRSFDDTASTVASVTAEEKGFVSSTSSDKLANGKVRGIITVRVPPENLDRFLLKIRALGELKSQQIGSSDVTKQYTDIESELRGLRTMEERLINLIKTGKGEVKDLVEAEKQLGDYRIRIEKLEGEIRYYNNLVGMATLTITAYEKDIQKPTAAAEQENINLSVETEEVEAKYASARKILDDAKARIVESALKNTDADHVAATITADVPPDKADFVAGQLKQLGRTASFTRDRRQTTTGGPGAPPPNVQVEQKDTRFSISLFNLANLAPRETAVLNVAVRDVETSYKQILTLVRKDAAPAAGAKQDEETAKIRAAGRVINSNINGQQPTQMSADIRAELRADQADAILQSIRDTGEVLTSTLSENPDSANTTAAKRGVQLRLVNIAAVAPRETAVMNIAVRDVEAAQKKITTLLQNTTPKAPNDAARPEPTGRILTTSLNGQQPEQMTSDFRAEIRADQAEAVLQAIRDTGEVLTNSSTQAQEGSAFTASKRGLQLRLINVAAVPARENQTLRIVAADVPDAYKKLLASLQEMAAAGNARVVTSTLIQSDPRTINATLAFEVRRDALPTMDKAFADAGIDFLSRNIARSPNANNTLDSKVFFQVDELRSAESLEPRRTITLGVEVENVDRAMDTLRSSIAGGPTKEVDFTLTKEPNGRVTGHIVLDAPVGNSLAVVTRIRDLGGIERDNQVTKNPQVPDTRFAKERIQLTLVSRDAIVESGKGLWPTVRAALSSAAGALLYSVYLVLTGLLFIAPFALLFYPLYRIAKRRKPVA